MTWHAMQALATALKSNRSIRTLHLGSNLITDAGVRALTLALWDKYVRYKPLILAPGPPPLSGRWLPYACLTLYDHSSLSLCLGNSPALLVLNLNRTTRSCLSDIIYII